MKYRTHAVFAGLPLVAALAAGCASTNAQQPVTAAPPPSGPVQVSGDRAGTLPVGQELDVRLQSSLSSDTAQVEDRFQATTVVDLRQGDRVLVPAGSVVRGVVSSVEEAGRLNRKGTMTLSFDQITVRGEAHSLNATAVSAFESEGIRGEAAEIGAGAGVGGIIGGILGGVKGALTGVLIGAGGVIAATEGEDVELPAGTIVRIRVDSPVNVR